eukprot:TRINITY_DN46653_c0_g1_i1.p1 TRINITY_DN46653_c0_g1~~TRINITY_DN46653_c0_g1_i1.p1  ORF type:complete len:251 (-),score=24.86 TRINITY_DN46653_c0_g1_i1:30-782(-)
MRFIVRAGEMGIAAAKRRTTSSCVSIGPTRIFDTVEALMDDDPAPRTVVMLHGVRFAPNLGASLRASHLLGVDAMICAFPEVIGRRSHGFERKPKVDEAWRRGTRVKSVNYAGHNINEDAQSLLSEAVLISMAMRHNWPLRLAVTSTAEAVTAIRYCHQRGLSSVCAETDTAGLRAPPTSLEAALLPHDALFVFGSEDVGVPPEVMQECHECVSIPTVDRGSLNISHSVALVLYERARQLRTTSDQARNN